MQRIYEPYKGLASYFLSQPVSMEEVKELKQIAHNTIKLINFNNEKRDFNELKTNIIDNKDGLYKDITINLEDETVTITFCQPLDGNYFISKKMRYNLIEEIEFTETLVAIETLIIRKELVSNYREIATKEWAFGIDYVGKQISATNYTKDIPAYTIQELNKSNNHYSKCLTKNKKIHNNVEK